MRFDAYTATIQDARPTDAAEYLAFKLGGIVARGKPQRRYTDVFSVDVGSRMAAWVGWNAHQGAIYVEGKGETSPALADAIRSQFPGHRVPRADVCQDYDEPGSFEALQAIVRQCKGPRVKGGFVALPDDESDGRTWAAGVRGAPSYVRIYEAGKHPDRVHLNRPNWSRIEGEFRPQYSRDKAAASTMSPADFWGLSAWTHKVGEAVSRSPINRYDPIIRQYSQDKTTRYIALTFRRHLMEMIANGEDIQRTFQAVWQEHDSFSAGH